MVHHCSALHAPGQDGPCCRLHVTCNWELKTQAPPLGSRFLQLALDDSQHCCVAKPGHHRGSIESKLRTSLCDSRGAAQAVPDCAEDSIVLQRLMHTQAGGNSATNWARSEDDSSPLLVSGTSNDAGRRSYRRRPSMRTSSARPCKPSFSRAAKSDRSGIHRPADHLQHEGSFVRRQKGISIPLHGPPGLVKCVCLDSLVSRALIMLAAVPRAIYQQLGGLY